MSVLTSKLRATATLCLCLILLAGCFTSKSSKFYVLHPTPAPAMQAEADPEFGGIGILPVKIPDYLDRPQIVTRLSSNELHFSEFDRWAEPLDKNITSVLVENLSNMLPTAGITGFPWPRGITMAYVVAVDVIQFEGVPGSGITLSARWIIKEEGGGKVFVVKKSTYTRNTGSPSYEAFVSAGDAVMGDLSREIADALKSLPRT